MYTYMSGTFMLRRGVVLGSKRLRKPSTEIASSVGTELQLAPCRTVAHMHQQHSFLANTPPPMLAALALVVQVLPMCYNAPVMLHMPGWPCSHWPALMRLQHFVPAPVSSSR